MRGWDQKAAWLGLAIGIFLTILSLRLNFGSWNQPGPGFMPLGTGILLLILCLTYLGWSTWGRVEPTYLQKESPWPRENRAKLIGVLAALFLYTLLIPLLGYSLTTFLLMTYLFRLGDSGRWFNTIVMAGLTVLFTYLLFEKWLMVQFPKGILGI